MKILFIIATAILVYLYWTELISPWLASRKKRKQDIETSLNAFKDHLEFLNKNAQELSPSLSLRSSMGLAAAQLAPTTDSFKEATTYLHKALEQKLNEAVTVNINQPVLLVGKADNLKIYYPDNTVELFSGKRWKKYKTPHKSVYSYASLTKSTILENLG